MVVRGTVPYLLAVFFLQFVRTTYCHDEFPRTTRFEFLTLTFSLKPYVPYSSEHSHQARSDALVYTVLHFWPD